MNRLRNPSRLYVRRTAFGAAILVLCYSCLVLSVATASAALPGIDEKDTRRIVVLAAEDCLRIALESNLDISISRYAPLISEADITRAEGEFDPVWSLGFLEREEKTPTTAQFRAFGVPLDSLWDKRTSVDTALQGKIPTGTTYSLDFVSVRSESTFTEFRNAEPEYDGSAQLALTQPLLKNFGLDVNLTMTRIARNNKDMSEEQLAATVMNTLSLVLDAYWDLVFARGNLDVARQSLKNARTLLEQNRLRVEVGAAAPIEVRQAEAAVKRREAEVVSAIAAIRQAEDALKLLFNVQEDSELWDEAIVPADQPIIVERALAENSSFETALQKRPELIQAKKALENSEMLARLNKNGLLPSVDLTGSYGFNALRSRFDDEVDYLARGDDWKFSYGVVGQIPLGNRFAKGTYLRSKYEADKQQLSIRQLEQIIRLEVRSAIRQIETNRKLVDTNRIATKLQERALEDEEKRRKVGASTSYRVLEFEAELALAKSLELQALVDYRKALISLDRAEGTILERHNIEFVSSKQGE
jgi:outer membrane protein TolC